MVRKTSYSDKTGLKRGAWSLEEDKKLTDYITRYGHWNWRELPRFAGLSRCGKSCRLRWMNYLRPDIKRGNFCKEEEELIINLHESLGNRWSAIAAKLPGRTDNEIKNHWHTHLKKRLKQTGKATDEVNLNSIDVHKSEAERETGSESNILFLHNSPTDTNMESSCSSSSINSIVSWNDKDTDLINANSTETLVELDTSFWTEPFIVGDSFMQEETQRETFFPFGLYDDDIMEYYCFNQLIPVELLELY